MKSQGPIFTNFSSLNFTLSLITKLKAECKFLRNKALILKFVLNIIRLWFFLNFEVFAKDLFYITKDITLKNVFPEAKF